MRTPKPSFLMVSSLLLVAACGGAGSTARAPQYPPSVLSGEADLVCNIDSKANGQQKLTLRRGGGLEFDAVVSPIVDGTVQLKGPDKGGVYRFTSHLVGPAKGKLSGVGDVEVTELETRVSVEVARYQQEKGPGSPFSFSDGDFVDKGVYIEFAGKARAVPSGEQYTFKLNLGASRRGSGFVSPADSNSNSRIEMKRVIVEAPITTVVVTTSVQRQP